MSKTGGRVLNPTAVFCNNRIAITMLGQADTGMHEGREAWCIYVLDGMLDELRKVDRLTDASYLIDRILTPALHLRPRARAIDDTGRAVLLATARAGSSASDQRVRCQASAMPSVLTRSVLVMLMLALHP